MADNKNYDRLPEESLAELRRKSLRKKPLYGTAPKKSAFLSNSSTTVLTYPRSADVLLLISVLIIALVFLTTPLNDGLSDVSSVEFISGSEYGVFEAIGTIADSDGTFGDFLSSVRIIAVCIIMITALIEIEIRALKTLKAFFKKNSGEVKINAISTWIAVFSTYAWLALCGRGNAIEGYSYPDFYISSAFSSALIVSGVLMLIASFVSLARGFSATYGKTPCWTSSFLLSLVYVFIALSMFSLNLSGLFFSAATGLGMTNISYASTNSGFECFLIAAFNVFLIIVFFKLKRHVQQTLFSEMSCALGFAKGYVKTSPTASTRVKAAILPMIGIFATAVLQNEETEILWPVYGLNAFLIKTVIALFVAAIVCKSLRDKTCAAVR